MQDNDAYMQYINQIREVLLNILTEQGEIANPTVLVNEYITLLERKFVEIGLTPEVFNPFLEKHITGKALAAAATASPITASTTTAKTDETEV